MKKTMKTEWNFKLFYTSATDKEIESDIQKAERAVEQFEKTYKDKTDYLSNSKKLLKTCEDFEKLISMKEFVKPMMYFIFQGDKDSNDKKAPPRINKYSAKLKELSNKIVFFKLSLGNIPDKQKDIFLKDPTLSKFAYFLKVIFDESKHMLSENEEKVINLLHQPAGDMWVSGFSKLLSNQTVTFKGKTMPLYEAMASASEFKTSDRRKLGDIINKTLFDVSGFAEAEMNAIVTEKKITDELRGYEKPYSSTVKGYQNEDATIEYLVDIVTKNFKIAHRFYKIKADLLGEKKLRYIDRSASIGVFKKKFTFDETIKILGSAFEKFDSKYKEIFDSYLRNGQIDVYPKKGKRGGAYCWGNYGIPTFVMLNHVNDFNSVITAGHEMGHAFHTELSHGQDYVYSEYTMPVAEVASTLFENFVFDEVYKTLSDKEKIIALHDKINGQIATIFRQIACFNFENELHVSVRNEGFVGKEEMAKMMTKHMSKYLGSTFNVDEKDGYAFVGWPHIRRFFYVYSYAFGSIISTALYGEYKKDKSFITKIEQFLKSGGSKSPEDIFADIGIDIRNPKFFLSGLKQVEKEIIELEKIVKGVGK